MVPAEFRAFARLAILALLSSFCGVTFTQAHEIRPSVADVTFEGDRLTVELETSIEGPLAGVDASRFTDTNDAPQAAEYDRLRGLGPAAVEAHLRSEWPRVSGLFVTDPVTDAAWRLDGVEVPPVGDTEIPRDSVIRFSLAIGADGPVAVGARPAFGPLILRHANAGEDAFRGYLGPGELSPPLPRGDSRAEGPWTTFARYIVLGAEHIVPKGLDHILFVLGLFFFSLALRPLLIQVTAFTAAHTLTLALASLGVVTVPSSIVEPLIAASIVFVAVENVLARGRLRPWRTAVVFGFGLLHGLGFASVLGEIGLGAGQFLISLIGFNLGVEVGQLFVIAVAYLALGLPFGSRPFYRRWIAVPASLAIGLTGLWWVIERTLL